LLTVLGTTIHNAGFFSDPVNNTLLTALPASSGATADGSGFAAGQFISGTTASGSGSGSDTLNLRYQTASGDGIMSCLGDTNTSGAPVVWTNSFAINAASQLTCAVGQNGAATGTAAVLTDNVAAMRVLYGVDTAGSGSADTYLDAAAVSASGAWSKVYSVQLVLTFHDSVNSTTTTQVNLPKTLRHTFYLMNQP
ncbi:MAG: PilW family protein, partial [Janthinobacterium lividum]